MAKRITLEEIEQNLSAAGIKGESKKLLTELWEKGESKELVKYLIEKRSLILDQIQDGPVSFVFRGGYNPSRLVEHEILFRRVGDFSSIQADLVSFIHLALRRADQLTVDGDRASADIFFYFLAGALTHVCQVFI